MKIVVGGLCAVLLATAIGSRTLDAAVSCDSLASLALPQTTITLRLEWSALGARFALRVAPIPLRADRYQGLSLRVGQSTEAKNAVARDQDFTLEVSSGSRTAAIPASALHRLLYPDVVFGAGKIVMQTLRLSSKRLAEAGVELSDLRSIAFVFDRRATGVLYVGDVQVSN